MITSPYNKPRITPPAEHPRVMLRRKDIIRSNPSLALENLDALAICWNTFRAK